MKIAVAGGSGFIGGHLMKRLAENGHYVLLVSRTPRTAALSFAESATWAELKGNPQLLDGYDAIVNLSGESINQRWTKQAKHRILQSRLTAAHDLAEVVDAMENKPKVVVNGSGMSIYGTSFTESYDERSPERTIDFLSSVVERWEAAARQISGTRLVLLRIGLVLASDGGALPKMMLPYKLGAGGKIGNGRQWLSWIHIHDMVNAIMFCIEQETIRGPVNCTAPNPVIHDEFGRTLARALHRPHWMPLPSFILRTVLGEMADLLLAGQRVLPKKLEDAGFAFEFPRLEQALADIAKRS